MIRLARHLTSLFVLGVIVPTLGLVFLAAMFVTVAR